MMEGDRNMWGLGGKPGLEAKGLTATSFTGVAEGSLEGPAREDISGALTGEFNIG